MRVVDNQAKVVSLRVKEEAMDQPFKPLVHHCHEALTVVES